MGIVVRGTVATAGGAIHQTLEPDAVAAVLRDITAPMSLVEAAGFVAVGDRIECTHSTHRRLTPLAEFWRDMTGMRPSAEWNVLPTTLYTSTDPPVRAAIEGIGVFHVARLDGGPAPSLVVAPRMRIPGVRRVRGTTARLGASAYSAYATQAQGIPRGSARAPTGRAASDVFRQALASSVLVHEAATHAVSFLAHRYTFLQDGSTGPAVPREDVRHFDGWPPSLRNVDRSRLLFVGPDGARHVGAEALLEVCSPGPLLMGAALERAAYHGVTSAHQLNVNDFDWAPAYREHEEQANFLLLLRGEAR